MLIKSFAFETVFVNSTGVVSARVKKAARRALIPLSAEISLELVEIPSGSFYMGSPGMEGYDDERPWRRVSVQGFLLGRTLVTQAVWEGIMGPHPFRFHGPQHPVDSVSCDAVEKFCNQVSSITGLYCRLPTEAEWEYACRAGGDTPFSTGQTLTTDLANFNGEFPFQGGEKGIYRHETLPVGSFPPNAFGLHDMHGGLWEWTADAWHPDYQGAPVEGRFGARAVNRIPALSGAVRGMIRQISVVQRSA